MGGHRSVRPTRASLGNAAIKRDAASHVSPSLPNNVGRITKWKNIRGEVRHFTIVDEIRRLQSDNANKLICLQKLWSRENRREEYRLGYYMIGVKPRMAGKWTWGQFATIIPARDFRAIVRTAERRGWF